jgi:hypothetical protein
MQALTPMIIGAAAVATALILINKLTPKFIRKIRQIAENTNLLELETKDAKFSI